MPSKKKKYNARFPAGRIKKIMQTDEEIGKVAQAVPVIISRTLELFVESLLVKAMQITSARNAKTLTPSHMKQCILSESRFDFLKDLVKSIPDVSSTEEEPSTPSGNCSPASTSSKTPTTFPGFSFDRRVSETSSSRSISVVSQNSTEDDSVFTPTPTTLYPKFYNEIPIGSQENPSGNKSGTSSPGIRSPVIQHTSGNNKNSNSSNKRYNLQVQTATTNNKKPKLGDSSSEEEEEVEDQSNLSNGYQANVSKQLLAQNSNIIDEDYDT